MVNAHHTVIELYVLLSIINAFLGVGTEIYQQSDPDASLRSSFNSEPLGTEFTLITVPFAIYAVVSIFSMVTNRLTSWKNFIILFGFRVLLYLDLF